MFKIKDAVGLLLRFFIILFLKEKLWLIIFSAEFKECQADFLKNTPHMYSKPICEY
jgi:hypothetical protein